MAKATPEVSGDIAGALKRLTDAGRGGMGSMFKVIGDLRTESHRDRGPERSAADDPRTEHS